MIEKATNHAEEEKEYNTWKDHKINYDDYHFMWFDLRKGKITETEWREFCDVLFKQELERNKLLKNR